MKKAFLVTANVTTRVVVDVPETIDEFAYDNIIQQAKDRLINNLSNDYIDQIEDVREDTEYPYTPSDDDIVTENTPKYYCPICGEAFEQGDWNYNYDTAKLDFECKICDWSGSEIEVGVEYE